ncbi:hypothetical protein KDK_09500 [Dictyobacter kobayashii]|uniref:Uncharacterized protein n=2 Tax=Dictyobacter kobayashii TaxID=2014872 RepID=A0A402ADG3_9CHLR|nr:hypothetical protein KDK_09500 [Dictyobacter kobayashii]
MDVCWCDLTDIEEMTFGKEILLKLAQCRLMPFQRFWTMACLVVGLEIRVDGVFDGQALSIRLCAPLGIRARKRHLGV